MLSKLKLWDFNEKNRLKINTSGAKAFFVSCPFLENLILNEIYKELGSGLSKIFSSDLTNDLVEETFAGNLFGGPEAVIIYEASLIKKDFWAKVLERHITSYQKPCILVFNKKTPLYQDLVKNSTLDIFEVELPQFWELRRYLNFLENKFQIRLDTPAKDFLIKICDSNHEVLLHLMERLQLVFKKGATCSLPDVKKYIGNFFPNQFKLGELLAEKQFVEFYKILLEADYDWEQYKKLFLFLQTHLLKMKNIRSLKGKRVNKYEEGLMRNASRWSTEEFSSLINILSDWESKARLKDSYLINLIRLESARFMKHLPA